MRLLLLLLLTAALAWGLWDFLHVPDEAPPPVEEPPPPPPPDPHAVRAGMTTGTLVIRVRTPGGGAPPLARAGYVYAGEPRLKRVGPSGEARFTDAPLGTLTVIARAPGFPEVRQLCPVQAGLRADAVLVLKPEADAPK